MERRRDSEKDLPYEISVLSKSSQVTALGFVGTTDKSFCDLKLGPGPLRRKGVLTCQTPVSQFSVCMYYMC